MTADREVVREFAVTLAELQLRRLIEYRNDSEIRLTDRGFDWAWEIWNRHDYSEKVVILSLIHTMDAMLEESETTENEGGTVERNEDTGQ